MREIPLICYLALVLTCCDNTSLIDVSSHRSLGNDWESHLGLREILKTHLKEAQQNLYVIKTFLYGSTESSCNFPFRVVHLKNVFTLWTMLVS